VPWQALYRYFEMTSLKQALQKSPVAFKLLREIYRAFVPVAKNSPIDQRCRDIEAAISKEFAGKTRVFFVQIGANDGLTGDPVHDTIAHNKNWSGIFIEPVETLFQKLKKNYGLSKRFIFENVAVSQERGVRKFYYVSADAKGSEEKISDWFDQIGSFDRNHILKHCVGNNRVLENYIVEQNVSCLPLQDILDKHSITQLDLVLIDTEGFDFQVLLQVDLNTYKPSVVLYEHYHLSPEDKANARSLLEEHGYRLTEFEEDTLARRQSVVVGGPRAISPVRA
jgi:FkbM family methyltransferase